MSIYEEPLETLALAPRMANVAVRLGLSTVRGFDRRAT